MYSEPLYSVGLLHMIETIYWKVEMCVERCWWLSTQLLLKPAALAAQVICLFSVQKVYVFYVMGEGGGGFCKHLRSHKHIRPIRSWCSVVLPNSHDYFPRLVLCELSLYEGVSKN